MIIFVVRVSEMVDVYRYCVSSETLINTLDMPGALRLSKIVKSNGDKVSWIEG